MSTYQSFQQGSATGSNILGLNKPTGLAVGDLLVAQISSHRNSSASAVLNTPAGWTLVANAIDIVPASDMSVFIKVADAADVAAINFVFTSNASGGTTAYICGHLLRFTNYGQVAGFTASSQSTSALTLTASSFTPNRPDCTFLFFGATHSNVAVANISSYTLATDNPSWTTRNTINVNTTNYDANVFFATATRPQTTATGTVTMTKSNSNSAQDNIIVVALAPAISGSIAAPDVRAIAYTFAPIRSTRVNAALTNPATAISTPTIWTNESQGNTTWINEVY